MNMAFFIQLLVNIAPIVLLLFLCIKLLDFLVTRKEAKKQNTYKPPKSSIQLLAAIIGASYTIYLISYFYNLGDDLGSSLATFIVTPHIICCVLGSVFMWVAFFTNGTAMSLAGAIMFCVAAAVFVTYAPMTIPIIILGFIGRVRIGRIHQKAMEEWRYEQTDFDAAFDTSSDVPVRRYRRRRSDINEL